MSMCSLIVIARLGVNGRDMVVYINKSSVNPPKMETAEISINRYLFFNLIPVTKCPFSLEKRRHFRKYHNSSPDLFSQVQGKFLKRISTQGVVWRNNDSLLVDL